MPMNALTDLEVSLATLCAELLLLPQTDWKDAVGGESTKAMYESTYLHRHFLHLRQATSSAYGWDEWRYWNSLRAIGRSL
jgi:hypothetical protein